jgi:integrase/recombinase XerD
MIGLIDEYKKELLEIATFEEKTVQNYTSCLISYFKYAKKDLGIDPIRTQGCHMQKWMERLKSKELSPSRLQHHRSALRTFFAFLEKMKIIKHNPAYTLPLIRRVKSEKNQPISKQVASKLLYSIDQTSWRGKRNFLIISILWALGLRLNELTSLKIGNFEADYAKREKIALLRVRGKNKKQRALFIVDKLYDYMINYLAHPNSLSKKQDPMFPTQNGHISGDRVQRMIKEYAKKAKISERITPHVLRHSFATEMYHQKVPLSAIQAMLGHSSIDETTIYIHVSDQLQKEALEIISITKGDLSCRF